MREEGEVLAGGKGTSQAPGRKRAITYGAGGSRRNGRGLTVIGLEEKCKSKFTREPKRRIQNNGY